MTLTSRHHDNDPRTAPEPHRPTHRRSAFDTPTTDGATVNDDEWHDFDTDVLAKSRARTLARREYHLTHGERPLPMVDGDGRIVLPPELLAKRAAEAAADEAERLAGLTPERLATVQTRRWVEWLAAYELHRPTYLRLSVGPRGEMLARQQFAPWVFEDEDPRHPDCGRVGVRGLSSVHTPPIEEQPRAYPNERVLDAITEQLLTASWLPAESNKPAPPTPLTFEERLQAMADEREARAAQRRQQGHNPFLGGGRGIFGGGW